MPLITNDPPALYRNIVHLLEHGLRTATYKLATLTALVDFCVGHRPSQIADGLEVPIPELAERVMSLYWRQARPFDDAQLHQSTGARSRILDSVNAVRSAIAFDDEDLNLREAARLAPVEFTRAVADIGLCLAQQPLPRLQRSPGSPKSVNFLYDDSFLHDNVSRAELQRHNNAIRLHAGIASGIATLEPRLIHVLQSMWIDDVIRINRIPTDQRDRISEHLFGRTLPPLAPKRPPVLHDQRDHVEVRPIGRTLPKLRPPTSPSLPDGKSGLGADQQLPISSTAPEAATLAARINELFSSIHPLDRQPYSSGEVASRITQGGTPVTASALSQIRLGIGPAPTIQTIDALAKFFGVSPAHLWSSTGVLFDEANPSRETQHSKSSSHEPVGDAAPETTAIVTHISNPDEDSSDVDREIKKDNLWGKIIGDDLNDVVAVCEINDDGCWLASSNSPVRCRPRNDARNALDLPKVALHRWAWMIDNGRSADSIPSHLIQIRRRCDGPTCCNPHHLFAAAPGGEELAASELAALLSKLTRHKPEGASVSVDVPANDDLQGRLVLRADLEAISQYCSIDSAGCWIAPNASPVACRASGDIRAAKDLPNLAAHRWTWMFLHGFEAEPLPGNMFQVRRRCGKNLCCRPEHLYLTAADGNEISIDYVENWLRSQRIDGQSPLSADRRQERDADSSSGSPSEVDQTTLSTGSGRHRAALAEDSDEARSRIDLSRKLHGVDLFADRLNALFDEHRSEDGGPYTSSEVANGLQQDGLAVSESLIARLRAASGELPTARTIDALAYFFSVDADYFAAGTHSVEVRGQTPVAVRSIHDEQPDTPGISPTALANHTSDIELSVEDVGRIITGLSQATSECLARTPADIDRSSRLLLLIAELGALLRMPNERVTIGRPLLHRIIEEWTRVGSAMHTHQSILNHLSSSLADGLRP